MNLVKAVSNILERQVTEDEAKDFALTQYGVLATYIRNNFLDKIKKEQKRKRKPSEIVVLGTTDKRYRNNS